MDGSADTVTRDALAEGLIGLLKPAVEEVDERVRNVRSARIVSKKAMGHSPCTCHSTSKGPYGLEP